MRGETFDDSGANPDGTRVYKKTTPDGVGLYYGFAEVRWRFGRLVRFDVRAVLGANTRRFTGGGGGQLLIGYDPGTHLALGVEGVAFVGVRAWLRLAWNTVPRFPMAFTIEATN